VSAEPKERTGRRVLVVDDDADARLLHSTAFNMLGHETEVAEDGIEGLAKLPLGIDLMVVDGDMPGMDGFELAERVRSDERWQHIPIVMVTGLKGRADRKRAMEVGVTDFLTKPLDMEELALRSKWLLELKELSASRAESEAELSRLVEERTEALREALEETAEAERRVRAAFLEAIRRLTIAAESKDQDTADHIERIGLYSGLLGRKIGMTPGESERLRHAAPMHDVGKIGVPDAILLKPGKLTDEEWVIMRSHTTHGAEILGGSDSPVLQLAERIALSHHERWDGGGYPHGIAGEEIPLEARICAVVDFYDALTMDRPYRSAIPPGEVLEMMREQRGKHFDPDTLDVFIEVHPEIEAIRLAHSGRAEASSST